MATPIAGYFAGLERVVLWLNDGNGVAAGMKGTDIANGDSTGAYVFSDVTAAQLATAQPQTTPVTGGDREVGQFLFGNPKLNQFQVTGTLLDPTLVAALSNSAVDENTNSEWFMWGTNNFKASPVNVGLILQQRFQPKTDEVSSAEIYRNCIIPRATAIIVPGTFGYRAVGNVTIFVAPAFSSAMHDGVPFADTEFDFDDNKADHFEVGSDYPLHVMSLKGNGSATTITTTYKPINTVVTINATKNYLAVDGAAQALTSIVVATGLATLASAPAAGKMAVLTYETQFKPV